MSEINFSEALEYAREAGQARAQVAILATTLTDIGQSIADANGSYQIDREELLALINVALSATEHDIIETEEEVAEPPKKKRGTLAEPATGEDF